MTPSIRNAKTRQRRKDKGMVEVRVWLDKDQAVSLDTTRAARGLKTKAEALVSLIPTLDREHPF